MKPIHQPPARPTLALPKAHLHLHLEGSARAETIRELAARQGCALDDLQAYEDLPSFITRYMKVLSVIKTPEDVARLCRELVEQEAAQGVTYLEPSIGPQLYHHLFRLPMGEVLALMLEAFHRASAATGVEVGVMVAVIRTDPVALAEQVARLAAQYAGQGVVAFGLAGDEALAGPEPFVGACHIAREAGLLITPHAGETVGPAGVWATLRSLRPNRLQHGVRAAEDPVLLQWLAQQQVACDVCLTSNARLGVVEAIAAHPLPRMLAVGVPVTLNADDALLFGSQISDEYALARQVFGLSDEALAAIARTSIQASAASPAVRARTLAGIEAWLEAPA